MKLAGIAPDQSPPLAAPRRLFYLMPLFLGLAGLLLTGYGPDALASRWSPAALAATHLVTLGVLAPVMCGALLQIAPVLLGAPYARVRWIAGSTAAGLGLGTPLLATGLLWHDAAALLAGGVTVVAALGLFLGATLHAMARAGGNRDPVRNVRLVALALAVTLALGLTLALGRAGLLPLADPVRWTTVHAAWGMAGWIGLLLMAIGMELIPMFYVTPPFATAARRGLPGLALGLLTLATLGVLVTPYAAAGPALLAAAWFGQLLFNGYALYLEHRRQRPRRDATLWLWQLSQLSVFAALAAWLAGSAAPLLGTLLLGGAVGFVTGALLKILPFLNWLDLQQQRQRCDGPQVALPRLRELLPERQGSTIATSWLVATGLLAGGALWPALARPGGLALCLFAGLLGQALHRVHRLRRATLRALG